MTLTASTSPLLDLVASRLAGAEAFRAARETLAQGRDYVLATPGVTRPAVVAALHAAVPRPTLVVVAGEEAARRFARQLGAYLGHERVAHFPERGDLPWGVEAPDPSQVAARAAALYALSSGREVVVVASARSLIRALPPQGSHVFEPLELAAGATIDLEEAVAKLARMGYERNDVAAEEPGQFAVRGGVLDVYPAGNPYPVRAELFGDDIETLRRYVPSTGQSIGDAQPTLVHPARELALGVRAADAAKKALGKQALEDPIIAHHLELIEQGVYFTGIERYMPLFYKAPGALTDYLAGDTLVVVAEPRSLFDDMTRRYEELAPLAAGAGVKLDGLFVRPAEIDLGGRLRLTLLSILRAAGAVDGELPARRPDVTGGEQRFIAGVRGLLSAGNTVALAIPDRRTRERIADALAQAGIADPALTYLSADVPAGYVVGAAQLAVVSIDDISPRSASAKRRAREVDPTKLTFAFKPGDYVVHASHGIALFKDMERKEVLGSARDYLVLEYARGDRLYVPVEQIDRITKYVGADGAAPRVTRLNTADWSRATGKARKAAKKLAFDLVDLYARRAAVSGRSFSGDTPWQIEMEAMFPYIETPDQLAAIADVKVDMESDRPMDRLICGDVGYGKTEVAIRAAFKAVQDGAQVMVLCPTTILAQQHYTTFSERFAPFPARVDVLSRFRTPTQQKATLEAFAAGEVDVLVGTHRLLSADVMPRSLGLVVIDEEQRFGVQHKEHLKNLREQVDVLAMSATPIPRTLQMSLSGVRDMSIIDTPPPNRFPVQVHVGEYDPDVVSGAIRRELERGGQVYFVSNRVKTIDDAVDRVRDAAPEARIGVAHGQMSEQQLERVMEAFAANQYDVLVSTTIVESGIDNPHTNTLIIEDSQRLGLAQLYQLKGRVGRSHIKAFAYFMFPASSSLTEQAIERLVAIGENTEFGSGIKIAMRDLEIRGAGSLLGAEQHGNMSAVGFDLYAEMLREAVAEARGEPPVAHAEIRVEIPVPAFLAEEYVSDVDERVRFYRRLAGAPTVEAVARVVSEITERFGAPPEAARNLVDAARIRALAADAGIEAVIASKTRVTLKPVKLDSDRRGTLAAQGATYREKDHTLVVPIGYGGSVTAAVLGTLDAILTRAEPASSDFREDS